MRLRTDQLTAALAKSLAPIYLVTGDEPQQLGEAADAIRSAARERGHANRELFVAEGGFDWNALLAAGESFSLFGDLRILDLRMSGKPDRDAAQALASFTRRLPSDAITLITMPKLGAAEQKAPWFQAIDSAGVIIQVWPLEGPKVIEWLDRRIAAKKMTVDRSGLAIIAARTEGNLLAAAQEVERLFSVYGAGRIDDDMIRKAVADHARYDVYALAGAMLLGQSARCVRILHALRGEGVAAPIVLWALSKDLRLLAGLQVAQLRGETLDAAFARLKVWDKQRPPLLKALQRLTSSDIELAILACARADRIIKGLETGETWDALLSVCLIATGATSIESPRVSASKSLRT